MDVIYLLRNICKEIDMFITWNRAEKQFKVLNEVYEEVSLLHSRRNAPPRLDYQPLFGKMSPHWSPRRQKSSPRSSPQLATVADSKNGRVADYEEVSLLRT